MKQKNDYFDPLELPSALLAYTLTPLPIDFLPSEMLSKVRETFEVAGCLCTFSVSVLPLAHSPLFSFLLVSSSSPSPHTVNHTGLSRPNLPVPNKLFRTLGNRGEGEEGRSAEKGIEGRAKHTICNRSSDVRNRMT